MISKRKPPHGQDARAKLDHPARGSIRRGRTRRLALLALAGTALSFPTGGLASTSLILSGNYLKIGVNDKGTLGVGGGTSPGILYDGTGTGTFNPAYDYLTPGSPFEGFTFKGVAGSAFTATNNNASLGAAAISGTLTSYNGVAFDGATYDQRAVWTGTYGGLFTVTHDYYFDTDGQQLNIKTTIEALADLTSFTFARFTDPDAVAAAGDSSSTNNFRGATGVAESDLVYAEALVSKYVIGLYTNDPTTHNSAITGWTTDPATYLSGTNVGNGDNTIGLGFDIGSLLTGGRITLTYRYIFGTDIAAAVDSNGGGGTPAPEPTPPPNIDTTTPYTVDQLVSGQVKPVFDGGVLTLGSSGSVATDFTILPAGGKIDTSGHELTLSGVLSGAGGLTKTGPGVLTLTGENSYTGLKIEGGVLAFGSPGSLGASDGQIALGEGGTLQPLTNAVIVNPLQANGGALDTGGHNVVLDGPLTGGLLLKTGSGTLTLNGANSQEILEIGGGAVLAGSAQSLGAGNGKIVLHANSGFGVGGAMTIGQSVEIKGDNARFDTGANTVVLTGGLSGSNCFIKAGVGHLNLMAAGSNAIGACVQEGQLSFNNVFTGNVWVDPGAAMAGAGQVNGNVLVGGTLSPGNSPGRLVVAGSVTQAPGSTLVIDIDGPTPGVGAGHYDTLVLTGAGSVYTAGGTLAPITRGITGEATNTYTPRLGDTFQIVTAQGGVTGAFSELVQPAQGMPANARFDVVYTANAVILAVTPQSYATLAGAGPLNAQAVGAAVDGIRNASGSSASSAAGAFTLGLLGLDEGQLASTLHRAAGEVHAGGLDAALRNARTIRSQAAARIGQGFGDGRRVWADVQGDRWKVEADSRAAGYRSDGLAVTVGLDRMLTPNLLVGAALGYGETDVDAGLIGQARSATYQGLAYAGWRSGPYYVDGVVAAGVDSHKTTRTVDLSTGRYSLTAKPDGVSVAADLEAGRRLSMGPAGLTLAIGLAGERAERDAVVETGEALAALRFEEATRESLQGRIGARIDGQAQLGGLTVTPQASVFVRQEFQDAASRLSAELHGAGFAVSAASPGKTSLELAAGLDAAVSERAKLSVGYRYGQSSRAESHAVGVTGSIRW